MTDALIAELSKIKALRVISRTSVMRYKKTEKPLPQIAGELNVTAIIEGSVQRAQDEVRITAQLIRAAPEKHVWANSFTKNFKNILALQSEVAQAIAKEIDITMTAEERQRLTGSRPVDPEAHEAYLKGRFFINKFTEADIRKGIAYFEQAIAKDPSFASAYTGLAEGYDNLYSIGLMPAKEAFQKVKTLALKALSIDKSLAEAYAFIGDAEFYDWKWKAAEENFKRAIELGDFISLCPLAAAYVLSGNVMKAREILADPRTKKLPSSLLAIIYASLGDKERGLELLEKAYEEREMALLVINASPRGFLPAQDSLLADPRFKTLLKKAGLEN